MLDFMSQLPSELERPEAIVVVSAHWEESVATLLGSPKPPMLYDYYGFPPQAYEISYPAPGNPPLAERISGLLDEAQIASRVDGDRGFDHGVFIPLKMMYPAADIPSIQLSLVSGLDTFTHLALGKALRPLMNENILVIGSGFSFHNLRAFSFDGRDELDPRNDAFQDWLIEVSTGPLTQEDRERQLQDWEGAPNARYCHPREEHLIPLHVCSGMAQVAGRVVFDDYIAGKRSIAVLWSSTRP